MKAKVLFTVVMSGISIHAHDQWAIFVNCFPQNLSLDVHSALCI